MMRSTTIAATIIVSLLSLNCVAASYDLPVNCVGDRIVVEDEGGTACLGPGEAICRYDSHADLAFGIDIYDGHLKLWKNGMEITTYFEDATQLCIAEYEGVPKLYVSYADGGAAYLDCPTYQDAKLPPKLPQLKMVNPSNYDDVAPTPIVKFRNGAGDANALWLTGVDASGIWSNGQCDWVVPDPKNIMETLEADPQYTILVTLLKFTGLDTLLKTPGPYTLFAPPNQYFEALGGTVPQPNHESKDFYTNILKYHVLSGEVYKKDLTPTGKQFATLQGQSITVTKTDPVKINDKFLGEPDTKASNGVIQSLKGVLIPGPAPTPAPTPPPTAADNIIETLKADQNKRFDILLGLLKLTELDDVLETAGPFTLLAPTDEAFLKLQLQLTHLYGSGFEMMALSKDQATALLKYHVLPLIVVLSKDVATGDKFTTAQGKDVVVTNAADPLKFNDVTVLQKDLSASNGVIQVMDEVLEIPPSDTSKTVYEILSGLDEFKAFADALQSNGIVAELGLDEKDCTTCPHTIFAPTNDAFGLFTGFGLSSAQEKDVLYYHIVNANAVILSSSLAKDQLIGMANLQNVAVTSADPLQLNANSNVDPTDILGSNGIIHVLDRVLIPPVI